MSATKPVFERDELDEGHGLRIDLPGPDAWESLCEQYRAALPMPVADPAVHVRVYLGYSHALWEVTQGLAKLFSHKKTIAVVNGEPELESTLLAFSQEGYTVKSLTGDDLENPAAWLDEIQTDLLFVLWSEDDPVTGAVHRHEKLQAALKDKRVCRILLSHARHRFEPRSRPAPYEARILSLRSDRALLIAGERCRLQPLIAHRLPWACEATDAIAAALHVFDSARARELRAAVLDFESKLPSGFQTYFPPETGSEPESEVGRVWDRSVLYHPDYDGLAVIDGLATMGNEVLPALGADHASLETTSPCRWESPRLAEWLKVRGESTATIRGLVILDAQTLNAATASRLEEVAARLRRIQEGSREDAV